jgi:L-iditol 2-dehydrogenase
VKALLYTQPYTFEYTDMPEPELTDDSVLVRVKACGICGSDVHGATGKTGRRLPPVIMGHEAAGVVEAVGANASGFKKGDRVCFDSTVYCNTCEPCRAGFFNRCEKRQVLGVSTPAFKRHGAFAEYVAAPWWIVSPLPEPMTCLKAALLEPVSIGLHAAKRGGIRAGETAVVLGAGTIGLFIIQAAKLLGAARVIASDVNEFRLEVAKRSGADVVVNPSKTDLREAVLRETDGKGAHVAYEAVGYAKTFRDAVSLVRMGGRVTAVGNLEKTAEFDLQEFIARELSFIGSYASSGEFRECIDLVATDRIDVMPLVSDVMPLAEGGRAFERLLGGKEDLLKIVLEP